MPLRERTISERNVGDKLVHVFSKLAVRSRSSTHSLIEQENTKPNRSSSAILSKVRKSLRLSNKSSRKSDGGNSEICQDGAIFLTPESEQSKQDSDAADDEDVFMDAVEDLSIEEPPTSNIPDYIALGAFLTTTDVGIHPDHINSFIHYGFSIEAVPRENLIAIWHNYGGENVCGYVMSCLFELFHSIPEDDDGVVPNDSVHLASYFLNYFISVVEVPKVELELVILAAYDLAVKIQRAAGISQAVLRRYDYPAILAYEIKIAQSLDFRVNKATVIDYMRLLLQTVCRESETRWSFAKGVVEIAQCHSYFLALRPTLLAGVVMRLTSIVCDGVWDPNCYLILHTNPDEYAQPMPRLCRLLLVAEREPETYKPYHAYKRVLRPYMHRRKQMLINEAYGAGDIDVAKNSDLRT